MKLKLLEANVHSQPGLAIIDLKVPSPGESITEVTISRWIVADGDVVEKDQELAEIESDKATLTINAEEAGKVEVIGNDGDDTFRADDDENDPIISGGPGIDTAYYDAGIDPTPAAVETRIPA